MNTEEIKEWLLEDIDCPQEEVNVILDSIQNLLEELKPVFEHLYKTGEYPSGKYKDDLEFIKKFIKNKMPQTTMLAVLLMYDGLLKNGLSLDNLVFE